MNFISMYFKDNQTVKFCLFTSLSVFDKELHVNNVKSNIFDQ